VRPTVYSYGGYITFLVKAAADEHAGQLVGACRSKVSHRSWHGRARRSVCPDKAELTPARKPAAPGPRPSQVQAAKRGRTPT
jgi:hypothetical protein